MTRNQGKLRESAARAARASECLRSHPLAHDRHPCARCGQSVHVQPDGSYEVRDAGIHEGSPVRNTGIHPPLSASRPLPPPLAPKTSQPDPPVNPRPLGRAACPGEPTSATPAPGK
jgi:hypothetical protein